MALNSQPVNPWEWPTLTSLPTPVKVLLSSILLTLALAMVGAMGQIIVHDIIPTFFGADGKHDGAMETEKINMDNLIFRLIVCTRLTLESPPLGKKRGIM